MKVVEIKASDLKVGDSVKHNSLYRVISEITFGEIKSVAESNKGEKIPVVFMKFSTYKTKLAATCKHVNSIVEIRK